MTAGTGFAGTRTAGTRTAGTGTAGTRTAGTGTAEARPGPVLRPLWQRGRFWLGVAGVVLLGGLLLAVVTPAPGRDLDPRSPDKNGGKALAQLVRGYGASVTRTTRVADAARAGRSTAVLVTAPDDYSRLQLRSLLAGAGRVVLLAPSTRTLAAVPGIELQATTTGAPLPGCPAPGALAAGRVQLGDGGALTYRSTRAGATRCYDGALLLDGRLAVLGAADLLRNDALGRPGVAALDVNVLTADRSLEHVVWLLPGTDAAGPGAPSVWDLFPAGAHRAFIWLLVAGAVVVVWRARRLGPPVAEPLPVVVRAAEVVEGHGRLYHRAGARDRAAAALRAGTTRRLARHVGLPRSATLGEVVPVVAAAAGQDAARVRHLLAGPPPEDDAALVELAGALEQLETVAGRPPRTKGGS